MNNQVASINYTTSNQNQKKDSLDKLIDQDDDNFPNILPPDEDTRKGAGNGGGGRRRKRNKGGNGQGSDSDNKNKKQDKKEDKKQETKPSQISSQDQSQNKVQKLQTSCAVPAKETTIPYGIADVSQTIFTPKKE